MFLSLIGCDKRRDTGEQDSKCDAVDVKFADNTGDSDTGSGGGREDDGDENSSSGCGGEYDSSTEDDGEDDDSDNDGTFLIARKMQGNKVGRQRQTCCHDLPLAQLLPEQTGP